MAEPSNTTSARLRAVQQRVVKLNDDLGRARSPLVALEAQKKEIENQLAQLKAKSKSKSSSSVGTSGDVYDQIFKYGQKYSELEADYNLRGRDEELAYQQTIEQHLSNVCTDLLYIFGRPLVLDCIERLKWQSPSPAIVGGTLPAASQSQLQPCSERPPDVASTAQVLPQLDLSEKKHQLLAPTHSHREHSPAPTKTGAVASHGYDNLKASLPDPELCAHDKRKAYGSHDHPGSSKRPRIEDSQSGGQESLKEIDFIDFEDVYQNGNAAIKYAIVQHPPKSDNYYILRCLKHKMHFTKKPTVGAAKHIQSKSHGVTVKTKGTDIIFKEFGVPVRNCTAALAAQNNSVALTFHEDTPAIDVPSPASPTPKQRKQSLKMSGSPETSIDKRNTRASARIIEPAVGEVYLAHWAAGKFYAALILSTGSLECAGIPGTLKDTGLLKEARKGARITIPSCYSYDPRTLHIAGWKRGYETGGIFAAKRKYPVLYFDGDPFPKGATVGWVRVKDLKEFNPKAVDIPYHNTVINFLETRQRPTGIAPTLFMDTNQYEESPTLSALGGPDSPSDVDRKVDMNLGAESEADDPAWAFENFCDDSSDESTTDSVKRDRDQTGNNHVVADDSEHNGDSSALQASPRSPTSRDIVPRADDWKMQTATEDSIEDLAQDTTASPMTRPSSKQAVAGSTIRANKTHEDKTDKSVVRESSAQPQLSKLSIGAKEETERHENGVASLVSPPLTSALPQTVQEGLASPAPSLSPRPNNARTRVREAAAALTAKTLDRVIQSPTLKKDGFPTGHTSRTPSLSEITPTSTTSQLSQAGSQQIEPGTSQPVMHHSFRHTPRRSSSNSYLDNILCPPMGNPFQPARNT